MKIKWASIYTFCFLYSFKLRLENKDYVLRLHDSFLLFDHFF